MKIRATLKLRNNAMVSARKNQGLSQHRLGELTGVHAYVIGQLEAMNYTHFNIIARAERIADSLELSLDEVLPSDAIGESFNTTRERIVDIDPKRLVTLMPTADRILPAPDEVAELEDEKRLLRKKLHVLKYREREVIKLRFGLGDGYCYTKEAVGRIFKVTSERIRQVEAKALRKLKYAYGRYEKK